MYSKEIRLWFPESYARIEAEYTDNGSVILTVSELETDETKSTKDNEFLKTRTTTEIYLDVDETKELIRSLQSLIPNEEV